MAENYSFFNSKDHDRVYNARHWADYFFPLFKSGVFNGDLQVVANGGMTVKIKSGYAWIDGYGYHLTDGLVVDLETASGNMNRADSIVIRLDLTLVLIFRKFPIHVVVSVLPLCFQPFYILHIQAVLRPYFLFIICKKSVKLCLDL